MSAFRIWLEAAYLPAFRAVGWTFVLHGGGETRAWAGGERRVSEQRALLLALQAALKAAPAGKDEIVLTTTNGFLATVPKTIAEASSGGEATEEDLDLWAALSTALAARPVKIQRTGSAAGTPAAFASAWAELSRDRAKGGPFQLAIPKTNVAKIQGLP
ncbi:hypothetical protein [Phenylobacterium deserti]|uniref:RNase H type-1 domain-containing protein n=1 Tax=Phenylobacterium deserti TaxID=1914756 RepID=A0A328A8X1_9CAUL|nr:hypothetical protein [Phenylobacterium deserti]RAK51011.1 hypothetical protein DJ018_17810 [Phenylobacterium deserti]